MTGHEREFRVVGRSVPRKDARAKVTGAAQYTLDLAVPRMAHAAVVRSEYPHAQIIAIDTSAAEAVDGVIRVITAADVPDMNLCFGHIIRDHPMLARDRTLYQGEPLAIVVAEKRQVAVAAARMVTVDAEEQEFVVDGRRALDDQSAVDLHPEARGRRANASFVEFQGDATSAEKNLCARLDVGWGDVDEALASADLVLENEYTYPMVYGYAMEPYCALADFTPTSLKVWTTTQHPYSVREDLARVFDLPLAQIRVQVSYVGGAYGTKAHAKVEPLACLASMLTGRPVKLVLSIEEAMLTTRADSAHIVARTGFRSDGTLVARDFDIVLNSGAYTDNSPLVTNKVAHRCFGPYHLPALRVRARSAYTNTVPASSLRGFGAPQGVFAGETQMDEAAEQLGINPDELRRRNLVGKGEEILPGRRAIETDLSENMQMLTEYLDKLTDVEPRVPTGTGVTRCRGAGIALSASDAGSHPSSVAIVRIHIDGSATGLVSSTELGQGRTTALAQIVAEELGLDLDRVDIVDPDTDGTPYDRATGASRTTTLVGRALQAACSDARARVRNCAAEACGADHEEVTDEPAGVLVRGVSYSYGDVIDAWFGAGGEIVGIGAIRRAGDLEALPPFWEIGSCGVQVDIDEETGFVEVSGLVTLGDVGFAINPAMTEGQDAGAAMMGIGVGLHEELCYEDGQLQNSNVVDYRVPRFTDLPATFHQMLVERRDGVGPYGAKGAGEGALNPMGAALASAVSHAIGARARELPLTPERVWRLIHQK